MTHNMKIKYPFYISENPFIHSLFHTAGFVSHTVKYVSHTVVFVFHSVKQKICRRIFHFIQVHAEKNATEEIKDLQKSLRKAFACQTFSYLRIL